MATVLSFYPQPIWSVKYMVLVMKSSSSSLNMAESCPLSFEFPVLCFSKYDFPRLSLGTPQPLSYLEK